MADMIYPDQIVSVGADEWIVPPHSALPCAPSRASELTDDDDGSEPRRARG